jgi:hypothetical protein
MKMLNNMLSPDYYTKAAIDIFRDYIKEENQDLRPLVPQIYPQLKRRAILFVSLNPSFNEKWLKTIIEDIPNSGEPAQYFLWDNLNAFLNHASDIEQTARRKYPFFTQFNRIAAQAECEAEHIDLYFYRETDQKKFKELVADAKYWDFWRRQLELAKQLMTDLNPRVVVVPNAYASQVFMDQFEVFPKTIDPDVNTGYHHILLDGRKVPLFLCSMLSGQRALDVFSRQRLSWHIRKALIGRV